MAKEACESAVDARVTLHHSCDEGRTVVSGSSESRLVLLAASCRACQARDKARTGLRAHGSVEEACRRTDVQCRMNPVDADHARTQRRLTRREGWTRLEG